MAAPSAPIYLDNHATTRLDPRVLAAMLPWLTDHYGNAGSVTHELGREARAAVEAARETFAAAIGGTASEIVFTGGATESNNLALLGSARRGKNLAKGGDAGGHAGRACPGALRHLLQRWLQAAEVPAAAARIAQ